MNNFKPLDGGAVYNALRDKNLIILAANIRIIPGVLEGIFQTAKNANSVIIIEAAKSECNLDGGYTGLTPLEFADVCRETAEKIGHSAWVLHADHIKTKSLSEIADNKKLILSQIKAGFTSFAIDASFMYNSKIKMQKSKLEDNIDATTKLADFIKKNYPNNQFGLEVEVGEIGKKDASGLVKTSPEEAVTYLEELKKQNIMPHLLAIANGSTHGNIYRNGKIVDQESIDIKLTQKIAQAIKDKGFSTRLAQHGTTGTPEATMKKFPKGKILKCNIGTHWMDLVWRVLKKSEPALFSEIFSWTIKKYKKDLSDEETFSRSSKFAIRQFKSELDKLPAQTIKNISDLSYKDAKKFIEIFNSQDSAKFLK